MKASFTLFPFGSMIVVRIPCLKMIFKKILGSERLSQEFFSQHFVLEAYYLRDKGKLTWRSMNSSLKQRLWPFLRVILTEEATQKKKKK